jgi:pimeloyl-ACP methyl ester carboxylesterase
VTRQLQNSGNGIAALMLPRGPGLEAGYLAGEALLFTHVLSSYLVDPPGTGASTTPQDPSGYSAEAHATFYEEVRKALGPAKVVV